MSDAYKIFRQLQEREKEAQQYKNYEREDLIDEIINLQQENQQLKEENKRLEENNLSMQEEMARTWKKLDDLKEIEREHQKTNGELREELQKANDTLDTHNELINHLQEVIEEVRKYMKENRTRYIYQDSLGEDWRFDDLDVYIELLQILDKAKGEDND